MREYREHFTGTIIDLDNPETYKHLPDSVDELDNRMFKEIGKTICYMDYWRPYAFEKEKQKPNLEGFTQEEIDKNLPELYANSGYNQRQRVYKLIENFTKHRRDNFKNLMWFKEQVFLLEDETENMC